jgi:hypothetical protein
MRPGTGLEAVIVSGVGTTHVILIEEEVLCLWTQPQKCPPHAI